MKMPEPDGRRLGAVIRDVTRAVEALEDAQAHVLLSKEGDVPMVGAQVSFLLSQLREIAWSLKEAYLEPGRLETKAPTPPGSPAPANPDA